MANTDAPFGFRPVYRDGSPYNGATLRAVCASGSVATFIGDAVKLDATTGVTAVDGYVTVEQAAAGDPVFGVVTAFEANPDGLSDQYRKASTQRFCQIVPVDSGYFEVQSDDDTTALAITDAGLNANFIVGSGNTAYGTSAMELDSSSAATTATLDLQIVGFPEREDNLLAGTGSTNKNVLVKFNDPQTKVGRTGIA